MIFCISTRRLLLQSSWGPTCSLNKSLSTAGVRMEDTRITRVVSTNTNDRGFLSNLWTFVVKPVLDGLAFSVSRCLFLLRCWNAYNRLLKDIKFAGSSSSLVVCDRTSYLSIRLCCLLIYTDVDRFTSLAPHCSKGVSRTPRGQPAIYSWATFTPECGERNDSD